MLNRFLGFLGFVPGLSGLSGLASGGGGSDDGFEAEGEAQVAFQPGTKLSSAEDDEAPGDRQARITDRDLVWPGKTETIQISNPDSVALRFDLTVTDLDSAFYLRRPAVGGKPQREGGILLQPGEDASFDVVFVPPPGGVKTRSKTFSFVLTCFDPRRISDPGEIVQDLPLRWVALPLPSDFQMTAVPPFIVTRPWRREARFAVKLTNKSFLPPAVGLSILRATTKDGLDRGGETVGTVEQALTARTSGVWQMTLPPMPRHGSYYAAVRGTAQTADAHSLALALPRPVVVRHMPWLRMGRDWLFLLGLLLFLFWLAWGIPVRKTPIVRVSLAFAGLDKGQLPPDSRLEDLTAQMILTDERGHDLEDEKPMPGVVLNNAFEFTAPPRWFGYRWILGSHIGWNGFSQVPQHFRIVLAPAEAEKAAFKRFDLNTLLPDGTPQTSIETAKSPYGAWVTPATYVVQSAHGVFVNLRLGALGALAGKNLTRVSVSCFFDGEEQTPRTFQLLHDGAGRLRPLILDLTDAVPLGTSRQFTAKVTAEGLSSYDTQALTVRRQDRPFTLTVAFPNKYPASVTPNPPPPPPNPPPGGDTGTGTGTGTGTNTGTGTGTGTGPTKSTGTTGTVTSTGTAGTGPTTGNTVLPYPHPPPPPPPPPPSAPARPENLAAQVVGPTQIRVVWSGVPGAQRYIVYRAAAPGQHVSTARVFKGVDVSQTAFLDTGLAPGTVYAYQVQAKTGKLYSPRSFSTTVMTASASARVIVAPPPPPPVKAAPVTVALDVSPDNRDLQATMDFTNTSSKPVYLDNINACLDSKIGGDIFFVTVDGHRVPFSGKKTARPSSPGPRQFTELQVGETKRVVVDLGRSYRLLPGTHIYTVTYAAAHTYPGRFQTMPLSSAAVRCSLSR